MKFSNAFIAFCGLVVLSSCAYIIPPEDNAPRNNMVIGEPHRPELNNSSSTGTPHSALTPHTPAQTVAHNDAPALPPVDAATQAEAEKEMAQAAPVSPVMGERHMPAENAPFETAGNDGYPALTEVPARPPLTGPDSAKDHLTAVKSDLEQDRAASEASKDTLAHDAAAEPSMLAPMPNTDMPPSITATPLAEPVVTPPKPIHLVPPGASAAPVNDAQPQATLTFKPLPATAAAVATATVPTFAAPAPLSNASPVMASAAPVMMRPIENPVFAGQDLPTAAPALAPAPISFAATTTARPNVKKGDFDPLAAADNAPLATPAAATTSSGTPTVYASDGYLAASRYAGHRN